MQKVNEFYPELYQLILILKDFLLTIHLKITIKLIRILDYIYDFL